MTLERAEQAQRRRAVDAEVACDLGAAARTTLALAPVVLLPVAAQAHWIFVRASVAEYLADWLVDAMREYRAPGPT